MNNTNNTSPTYNEETGLWYLNGEILDQDQCEELGLDSRFGSLYLPQPAGEQFEIFSTWGGTSAQVEKLSMYRPSRVIVKTRSISAEGERQIAEHVFVLRGDIFELQQCFVESTPEDVDVHPEAVSAACFAVASATQRKVRGE